jgi:hypothetical protein
MVMVWVASSAPCAQGAGGRVIGERDAMLAQVADHVLRAGYGARVGSAAGAPAVGGLGSGQQQVQPRQLRQDAVLAHVGVISQHTQSANGTPDDTLATLNSFAPIPPDTAWL